MVTGISSGETKDGLSFGPFNLVTSARLLTINGAPVELGARALDILIVLISRPNEIVTKKDLLSQVWPDVTVEEGSLRFQMSSLRKALGDGKNGARYITTIAGRGYCFVAPVSQSISPRKDATSAAVTFPHANLPNRLGRMIGRDDDVLKLSAQLTASRFVTIVGVGGGGKTTVAVAVGHHLTEAFQGAALFVDLGMLSDPKLVTTAVASMLGLSASSSDVRPALMAYLRDKRILLILDTCEHLVDSVADLASSIRTAAPEVHILATSREALRTEGEHVYRLDALACPTNAAGFTAAAVHSFPATKLFVECAVASGAQLEISDAEAPVVASICQRLDGVALAIELAARRVESYGLQQTAALLDQHLNLAWSGSRTAPPRQRTMQATLDWSYELLSESERLVLCRLAIFVGHFTLDAALEVISSDTLDRNNVFAAIDSLVQKSMVATRPIGAMVRYRLLDTTRAYALEIGPNHVPDLAVRHASYYRRWLEQVETEWPTLQSGTERAPYFAGLNNVRTALEWCFGPNGNITIGVELAAAAAPLFLAMSLLPECHRWSERALLAIVGESRGGREEMQLQASLAASMIFTRGHSDAALAALNRSLDIARARGDLIDEVRLLGQLHMYRFRGGEFRAALQYARRSFEISQTLSDAGATALSHALLGISLQLMGDLDAARAELEAALAPGPESPVSRSTYFAFDHFRWAGMALTSTLWLQGHTAQALARARQAVEDAEQLHHPVSLAILLNAVSLLLWVGDLDAADRHLARFIALAESQYFGPYLDVGKGLKGELSIRRGDVKTGIEMVRDCVKKLHAVQYERFTTHFHMVLIHGLATSGQIGESADLIDETVRMSDIRGDNVYIPEMLRLKGKVLLAMQPPRIEEAESCLLSSLEVSRAHGSRAWELRTATDLAGLWASQGRSGEARALMRPIVDQFADGPETADFKVAERMLAALTKL
jgi:predicted ATPase/DNA-binding winged helix-turn-helix (wHTH) protein